MKRVVWVTAIIAMTAPPALAIDGLRFGDIDSTRGVAAVSAKLDSVVVGQTPKFSELVSGRDVEDRRVMMGSNGGGVVQLISVTWDGGTAPNDLRTIGNIEETFGIAGADRTISDECDPQVTSEPEIKCTRVEYGCVDDWCPVSVLSFYRGTRQESGTTTIRWRAEN